MILEKVEVLGFRGLVKEEFTLNDMTVFYGEMGSGKTSRLLAILWGLTGESPQGLSQDELINISSDFMWVKLTGSSDDKSFTLERRKRRGQAAMVKGDAKLLSPLDSKIFIEGREISKLFAGAPAEKSLKMDALLGLSDYSQIASEISVAAVERRMNDLVKLKTNIQQATDFKEALIKVEEELKYVKRRLQDLIQRLEGEKELFNRAEEVQKKADASRIRSAEARSKSSLIQNYRAQLSAIEPYPEGFEDEVREVEARYAALERRTTFLEAAMQSLDLTGKKIEEIKICPLCGAKISPEALEAFRHYDDEYRDLMSKSSELQILLEEKRRVFENMRRNRERAEFLKNQIKALESELATLQIEAVSEDDLHRAAVALKMEEQLLSEKRELEIRREGLQKQAEAYRASYREVYDVTIEDVDKRVDRLRSLADSLNRIKMALMEALNEARIELLNQLKASFKTTFARIYPYRRFDDIDFEMVSARGRDVLTVRARLGEGWMYPNQMSTGENVAISFALLFTINQLERSPLLLLDEPEEGLDEEGIKGLSEILYRLKENTQIVVATRSLQLAELLQPKVTRPTTNIE